MSTATLYEAMFRKHHQGAWQRARSNTGSVDMTSARLAILERHAAHHDEQLRIHELTTTGDRIIGGAKLHLGLHETPPGSNRGPLIDAWQRRCGLVPAGPEDHGWPWCAAFATCDVVDQGGSLPGGVTASCYAARARAQAARVWIPASPSTVHRLLPGWIGIVGSDEHMVLVMGLADGLDIIDISGNTSESDGTNYNGGNVAIHTHPLSEFSGFIPTWGAAA